MKPPNIAIATPTSDQSFEQTYQEAYSHGLETIYALENVDLATVKPLKLTPTIQFRAAEAPSHQPLIQLLFDFEQLCRFPKIFKEVNGGYRIDFTRLIRLNREEFLKCLRILSRTYLIPWIERRLGFASKLEIIERLEMCATHPEVVQQSFKSLQKSAADLGEVLSLNLFPLEENLFASSKWSELGYQRVVETADSYFYRGDLYYEQNTLSSWLEREIGKQWEEVPIGFVKKVLNYSCRFSVTKSPHQNLLVYIN